MPVIELQCQAGYLPANRGQPPNKLLGPGNMNLLRADFTVSLAEAAQGWLVEALTESGAGEVKPDEIMAHYTELRPATANVPQVWLKFQLDLTLRRWLRRKRIKAALRRRLWIFIGEQVELTDHEVALGPEHPLVDLEVFLGVSFGVSLNRFRDKIASW